MNLKQKTEAIQHELLRRNPNALPEFGADSDYGHEMADALLAELSVKIERPPHMAAPMTVRGTGKDIKRIFLHCTATREGQDIDAATIRAWHKRQGWSDIGYHFVIGINGTIERGRPEHKIGSHVRGHNRGSIGVVYVGGLDAQGNAKDTRTDAQKAAMASLARSLVAAYPGAEVLGHRDISPDKDGDGVVEPHEWLKMCPCFDVRAWWKAAQ